jgi:alkylation response protein AidB-like acyl-CoA dehydrogenase
VTVGARSVEIELTDEQRLLAASVADLARARGFRDLTAEADRAHAFPWPIWEALVEVGLPGLDVPVELGGQGGGCVDVSVAFEVLGAHSIAATTSLFTFAGFGAHLIDRLADHPLRLLLPELAAGSARASLGLTEPTGGTDLSRMRTVLRRSGDGWRLQGSKLYATLAAEATHLLVGCLLEGEERWHRRFAFAVVPEGTRGVAMNRVDVDALRPCPTYEVFLDEVEVPDELVITPPHAFAALMDVLNQERVSVASQSLGFARRALELALEQTERREVVGGTLDTKQVVAHRLVDCWEQLEAARLLVRRAAGAVDAGERGGVLATMAQRRAAAVAHTTADAALQFHGGSGLERDAEVHRLWRDTRLHLMAPINAEQAADQLFRQMRTSFG